MTTIRVLEKNDIEQLDMDLPDGWRDDVLDDGTIRIICAQDEDQIIGCVPIRLAVICEPVFIKAEYRNGMIAYRMFRALLGELRAIGVSQYLVHSESPEVEDYLRRLGLEDTQMKLWKGTVS